MLKIKFVNGEGGVDIRSYLRENQNTLVYTDPRYIKLISNHLDAKCGWIVAHDGASVCGVLPFLCKSGPLGAVYNSLPYFGSNGGVIQNKNDNQIKVELIHSFYEMAARDDAVSATIITNPLFQDSKVYDDFLEYSFLEKRIGQITHLPKCMSDLIKKFDDPRPRNIKKAIKCGVQVFRKGEEALDFLHNTHVANMLSIGGAPKKKSFFDSIPQIMERSDWDVYVACVDDREIAALLVFYNNITVEYFTPAIVHEWRSAQPLSLIIYRAMCDAIGNGFRNWNWGGTWLSQNGVYDFKKRWGTSDYNYYYYTKLFNKNLLHKSRRFILNNYDGFFVVPFDELESFD